MFAQLISVLIVNLILVTISAGSVSIQKCKGSDAACILQSANAFKSTFVKGIPEYKVLSLETLHFPFIDASLPSIKLVINNAKFQGVDKCEVLDVRRDVEKQKLYVQVFCNVDGEGIYDMKGKLLFLPIEGNGKVTADVKKILVNIDADIVEKRGNDNKPHWSLKHWSYTYELKDKAKIHFDNLLPRSEDLAKAAEDVIRENGNKIIAEVGAPVLKAAFGKIVENIANLFKAVPIEDLTLDN